MPRLIHKEAHAARRAYVESLVAQYHDGLHLPLGPGPRLPSPLPARSVPAETRPINKVAIIGGGVAGLRAAMLLGSNFNVDLYEAGDEVGGRLFTHHFRGGGEWDYFDVGAMRFPKTDLMKPTFDLFDELGLTPSLLDYKISVDENVKAFNLERHTVGSLRVTNYANDPFKVGVANRGTVPDNFATQNPGKLLHDAIEDLINLLVENREAGIARLKELDFHTTRSYLRDEWHYPPALIDYIETMSFGTGWFDRALAETVFEELCFQYDVDDPTDLDWYCVKGGSYEIIKRMKEKLDGPEYQNTVTIKTKHRVTTAVFNNEATADEPMLTVSGLNSSGSQPTQFSEQYSHVIFALPPPCLRTIDLSTCHLDFEQRNALRIVSVGPSCKIGIKFKSAWWTRPGIDIKGGQSTTDRMARTIVYPSYGDGKSTVLIASYSWTQDAVALGAWIQGRGTPAEARLKELMLADLEFVHHGHITLEELNNEYEDMFPWDWTHHPDSMGAFGLFGPDQYRQYYCALTRPAAGGHMHFVGETISTIHGQVVWVAGALESAERGVKQVLELNHAASGHLTRGIADATVSFAALSVDSGREDPLAAFNRRNPNLGVEPGLLDKQLALSKAFQVAEFGPSSAFA
ncbi:unnamed protein product [Rhizoctonia solani]|uniref:Amine oxidase domain-containing protein n=1 Tax=Rhizoctonia solani TaxID=456999 RepID=A0A8H3B8Y6_9AGAM|nr:unnamed protein product [Rhizoctonia solani]